MRQINHICLHCTATSQKATIEAIQRYWREQLGWKSPGYHWIITPNGTAFQLLPIEKPSNGVKGHNHDSVHISYIGGIDKKGNAIDNRTPAQIHTQKVLIGKIRALFPYADIRGHRDFPGVTKMCPSFDVGRWCESEGIESSPQRPNI